MRFLNTFSVGKRGRRTTLVFFMVVGLTPLSPTYSQNSTMSPQQHQGNRATDSSMTINQQLVELRGNIARLEAALEQDHRGSASLVNTQVGMGSMGCGEGGCGQPSSGMKTEKVSGMAKDGMGKMGMSSQRMGMGSGQGSPGMKMGNMGMMGNMGKGKGQMSESALPGFPGASHLYHIGETNFFLDHGEHIDLTQQQKMTLNQIKEQALLSQATLDRQLEQAEQELWVLTSSDQPDVQQIEKKIRQIETLKGDQRLAFIRAVGKAAKELTEQQRQVLIGTRSPPSKVQGSEQK